jgi:hypothetical protein
MGGCSSIVKESKLVLKKENHHHLNKMKTHVVLERGELYFTNNAQDK